MAQFGLQETSTPSRNLTKPIAAVVCVALFLIGGQYYASQTDSQFRRVKRVVDDHAFAVTKVKYGDTVASVNLTLGKPMIVVTGKACSDDPTGKDKGCTIRIYYGGSHGTFEANFRDDRLIDGLETVFVPSGEEMRRGNLPVRGRPNGAYTAFGNGYYRWNDRAEWLCWDESGAALKPNDFPGDDRVVKSVSR